MKNHVGIEMSYYDFSEPMPKSERARKLEYADEKEKFAVTSNYVKLPFSSEVIARTKREPRAKSVSPLLESFLNASNSKEFESKSIDNRNPMGMPRVMSKASEIARNEVFKKLGIAR